VSPVSPNKREGGRGKAEGTPKRKDRTEGKEVKASRPRSLRAGAHEVAARLAVEYPGDADALCALRHRNPFELLVATILSAQSTDERVNMTTPAVFKEFGTPEALAAAPIEKLEPLIYSTGFFRAKARSLVGMARAVTERFGGEVPSDMADLTSLPGVGRKTANVVRSVGFGLPGLPVDTHVGRLARRLGLTKESDPDKVEADLTALLPPEEWGPLSLRLILHGRRVCQARTPKCTECVLADICPSARLPIGFNAAALWKRTGGKSAKNRQKDGVG
jgi:endonuclease III